MIRDYLDRKRFYAAKKVVKLMNSENALAKSACG
jgi:hypothetical protein